MDPFLEPIKSVLPSVLTIITMRAGKPGIMAGEIRLGVGTAHAAKINPQWMGLPHFIEHMIANGASRSFGQDEAKKLLRDKFFTYPNAWTNLTETRYFNTGGAGFVFPSHSFWPAFETTIDGVFFPKFDAPTFNRERERILEEISENLTQLRHDDAKCYSLMGGADYLGLQTLGSADQVSGYTYNDCASLHARAYGLRNTCIVVTGDVEHIAVVERIDLLLRDAPKASIELPLLDPVSVKMGEFRRHKDGSNQGHTEIYLNFATVDIGSDKHYATYLAANALSEIIDDKVKDRFGLYTAQFNYRGWADTLPVASLNLITGKKEKATDALQYALEIMRAPETYDAIARNHGNLLSREVTMTEVDQPSIEQLATKINYLYATKGVLFSPAKRVEYFQRTSPPEVANIITEFNSAPVFLNLRGHKDSLDCLPPIETIDAWRGMPNQPLAGQPRLRSSHLDAS